jgi:hypothetical protein
MKQAQPVNAVKHISVLAARDATNHANVLQVFCTYLIFQTDPKIPYS